MNTKFSILTVILLLGFSCKPNAQESPSGNNLSFSQKVERFIDTIKLGKEEIAKCVDYPLIRRYPIPPIKNEQEFIDRYDEVFDNELTNIIINSNIKVDWHEYGKEQKALLHDGLIWLASNGNLRAVNTISKAEEEYRDRIVHQEKQSLHKSIRKFECPILIMETEQFRIRIDDLGNENYRFVSWAIDKEMSDEPDLIILNGEISHDKYADIYDFEDEGCIYHCYVIHYIEEDLDFEDEEALDYASFEIERDGKLLLSQDAINLKDNVCF